MSVCVCLQKFVYHAGTGDIACRLAHTGTHIHARVCTHHYNYYSERYLRC
jgi:hypothetical protein